MGRISLHRINKVDSKITYEFEVSYDLKGFFTDTPFVIEYPFCVETIPDSVAAIPFVCNILPIIWLTDSELHISELDKNFYDCIPEVRGGYERMFPESVFAGNIIAKKIIENISESTEQKAAAFFSGGLDAVNTLVNHLDEKPALISIWGSDIAYSNSDGWGIVHNGILDYVRHYSLEDIVIRSTFREFDNEVALDRCFSKQLKDGWWHGVKHSLALLGHAAPYAYLCNINTVYFASSNCPDDKDIRCASHPTTDNHVRFVNAQVKHDGFKFSRQDKLKNVVDYVRHSGERLSLHVCWESQHGGNCCHCEKCYRTIVGLIAEGVDPREYGFDCTDKYISRLRSVIVSKHSNSAALKNHWIHIQKRMIYNKSQIKNNLYWKDIKWILKVNFLDSNTIKESLIIRIRTKMARFKFYQNLHKIKERFND